MNELDRRRDELQQAIAAGLSTMAQLLVAVSDTVARAAETLESIADKLEDEDAMPTGPTGVTPPTEPTGVEPPVEPPVEPTGPTTPVEPMPTGATGVTGAIEPDPTGPTGPPTNP